jgi:hypothetical protein
VNISLGLNYCSMGSSWPRSLDTVPLIRPFRPTVPKSLDVKYCFQSTLRHKRKHDFLWRICLSKESDTIFASLEILIIIYGNKRCTNPYLWPHQTISNLHSGTLILLVRVSYIFVSAICTLTPSVFILYCVYNIFAQVFLTSS